MYRTLKLLIGLNREFEYQRHGTLTLIGNFHVVTGEFINPTLGPTRTEEDFVKHIAQTIQTEPEPNYVFVVDNLMKMGCLERLPFPWLLIYVIWY